MSDADRTHASTALPRFNFDPALVHLDFFGRPIRATRHPVRGRLLMAKDVVEAVGYKVRTYTSFVLNGLKVSEENRILLKRGDFDISDKKLAPTFDSATFLTRAGLDQLVAGAAAKKVRTFAPWMVDVMENGVRPKVKVASEVPPEGLPWEE